MERAGGAAPVTPHRDDGQGQYLGHLLHAALSAPGARSSPIAGRVIAVLMGALAAQGDEQVVATYLSPDLADGATFTVRSYGSGGFAPMAAGAMGAAEALALAGSKGKSAQGVEVVGHSPDGLERCALTRSAGGELTFVFPDAVNLQGDPARCAAALQRWADIGLPEAVAAAADAPAVAVGESLRDALADLTVRVDLGEVTQVVKAGMDGVGDDLVARLTSSLVPATAKDIARALAPLMPTAAEVAAHINDRAIEHVGDKVGGQADTDGSVGRNDPLRSRPRRRKRQSTSAGGSPWANGPTEG